jgi:hypothetical protein
MAQNTCNGANTSPELAWTGAPAAAKSWAIVLTDKSNNLVHWVIYDVPGTSAGLPANVEKAYQPANVQGAKQTTSYQPATRGYLGPCPPTEHTYQFALYALDVATLPNVTMSSTRTDAETEIKKHVVATATLTGKYKQP